MPGQGHAITKMWQQLFKPHFPLGIFRIVRTRHLWPEDLVFFAKKSVYSESPALLLTSICFGADIVPQNPEGPVWSRSFTQQFMSEYFGTWVGGVFRKDPFSFTTIALSRPWMSGRLHMSSSIGQALDHVEWNHSISQELDAEIGYALSIGHGTDQLDVAYTLSYIGATPLEMLRNDIASNVVQLRMPNTPVLKPYLTLIRSDTLGKAVGSGWFAYGGAAYPTKLTKSISMTIEYRIGYSGGIYGTGKGWDYHRIDISFPIRMDRGWTVIPEVVGQVSAHGQPVGHEFVTNSRLFTVCTFTHSF